MKTNVILLFLCSIFTWTGLVSWGYAASPSYERMKTLIWKHTIYFIYEDNDMIEQYMGNYGTHSFGRIADFENLKDEAGERRFYQSVQDSISTEDMDGEKEKIEKEVDAIILGLKKNRQSNLAKLAKVDSLQRTLYYLIQDEYQEDQQQAQSISNAEEINDHPDTFSSNNWFIIGPLILILLLMVWATWRMGKLVDRFVKKVKYILEEKEYQSGASYGSYYPSLSQSDVQQLDKKLIAIQEETESIKEQINQLYALIERTSSSSREMPSSEHPFLSSFDDVSPKDRQPVTESRATMFYAKKPNDKLFKHETLSTTARHDSIYCIQEDTDGMATFTINYDKKVQDYALQNGGEMFLNEACEIQYENNRPVRITTEVPGKLVKEGKHWRIQEKARVTLK